MRKRKLKVFATFILAFVLAFANVPQALVYAEDAPEAHIASSGYDATVKDIGELNTAINGGAKNIVIKNSVSAVSIWHNQTLMIPKGVTVTLSDDSYIHNYGSFINNGTFINNGDLTMEDDSSYRINGILTNKSRSYFRVQQDLLFDGTGKMVFETGSKAIVFTGSLCSYIGPEDDSQYNLLKLENGTITFTKGSGKKVRISIDPPSLVTVIGDAPIWRDQIVYVAPEAVLTVNSGKVLNVMDPADGRSGGMIINDGTVNGEGTVNNLGTVINNGSFTANLTGNKLSYTVTFDANGGSGTMEPQVIEEDKSAVLTENKFTKDGYNFDHWSTNADGSGDIYKDKEEGITLKKSLTLYAQWIPGNTAFDVRTETVGDYEITYPHEISFPGKGKLTAESFGENFTVLQGNASYKVKKIKVNKKKKRIQITKLADAPKDVEKAVKKATKGDNGVPYTMNPYYVKDTDTVKYKFKKSGKLSSVKVDINGKLYKAKKTECEYDDSIKAILFKGDNLAGSYIVNEVNK